MDRYAWSARVAIGSLAAIFCVLVLLNALAIEPIDGSWSYVFLQATGLILTLLFWGPAFYLWVTGFTRFKEKLGEYSPMMLFYLSFNVFAAVLMQLTLEQRDT
jgi:uncharacterized membrane protein